MSRLHCSAQNSWPGESTVGLAVVNSQYSLCVTHGPVLSSLSA